MLTGLVATLTLLQPRASILQRTSGGATVSVEASRDKRFAVCLALRVPADTPPWHAHLAEHLLINGKDGRLPARLQTYDISIQGVTTRNQICITLEGPSSDLNAAVVALGEILEVSESPKAAQECALMREESALRPAYESSLNALWLGATQRGSLYPGDGDTAPTGLPKPYLTQSGAAVSVQADADTKPVADALLASLSRLDSGPKTWPGREIPPSVSSAAAKGIRIGAAGSANMLSGAAAAYALSGVTRGVAVFDLECAPSYAFVVTDAPVASLLDSAAWKAPQLARELVDRWTSDPVTWTNLKAVSLLAGLRIRKSDLTQEAATLNAVDYAAALQPLRP